MAWLKSCTLTGIRLLNCTQIFLIYYSTHTLIFHCAFLLAESQPFITWLCYLCCCCWLKSLGQCTQLRDLTGEVLVNQTDRPRMEQVPLLLYLWKKSNGWLKKMNVKPRTCRKCVVCVVCVYYLCVCVCVCVFLSARALNEPQQSIQPEEGSGDQLMSPFI